MWQIPKISCIWSSLWTSRRTRYCFYQITFKIITCGWIIRYQCYSKTLLPQPLPSKITYCGTWATLRITTAWFYLVGFPPVTPFIKILSTSQYEFFYSMQTPEPKILCVEKCLYTEVIKVLLSNISQIRWNEMVSSIRMVASGVIS